MRKCSAALFIIILVQLLTFHFNFNDFLIDMGLRRKCGDEKLELKTNF